MAQKKRAQKKRAAKKRAAKKRAAKKRAAKKRAAKKPARKKGAARKRAAPRRAAASDATSGYYRQPTIHGDRIVFVSEDDLWEVAATGGVARRLTSGGGVASSPRFSPDGKRLLFTATYDGPTEAYVMDSGGGEPRRLTFFGGMLRAIGWSRDGKKLRVSSNAGRPFLGDFWLHELSPEGGPTTRLDWGPVREISEEPGGQGVVLGINAADPARWKRYRGGTRGRLLIDRTGKGTFEPLFESEGNLASPMWIGKRVYFLSDHEGHANLYSCTPTGRGLKRHTHHEGFFARWPSTDGKRVVYSRGADLYVYDIATDKTQRIDVTLRSPRSGRARRFVPGAKYLETVNLHPAGHSAALVARGGAFTLPLWDGAVTRHGNVSSARHRHLAWLPDGERLVCVSDDGGEEALHVFKADGTGRPKRIRKDLGRALDLAVAPRGKDRVAISNHRQELWIVDLGAGTAKKIDKSPFDRLPGMAWSPDGRWLAYSLPTSHTAATIRLYDTRGGRITDVTGPDFLDYGPSFDPEGKYLYFLSGRIYDPVYDNQYFDLGFPNATKPYLVPLAKDTPSPFSSATRTPRGPGDKAAGKRKGDGVIKVDLAGIGERIVEIPVAESRYLRIRGARGRVYFSSQDASGSLAPEAGGPPPAKSLLQVHVFDDQETKPFRDRISDFDVTADGRSLLLRIGNRLRVLSATSELKDASQKKEAGRASGWVDEKRVKAEVLPGAEWRQMFREAWRLQRDHFWTKDMSGVAWHQVHDDYLPLVDRVATRSEFSDLMWEVQGELGTSHNYEMGGDYGQRSAYLSGLLGADLAWDARARGWKIRHIPRGDSWNAGASSPLAEPGQGLKEGDVVLAVGGRAVSAKTTPYELLVNVAGQEVVLSVKSGAKAARNVTVKTLRSETDLRYRAWVEANRAWVHKQSRGRVGYVHIPNMGPRGFSEFHRYYKHEVMRDGLIVDVRWNGGGHVSQLLLEKLIRRRIGYDETRWMGIFPYPDVSPTGCLVALTNEYAGSDGDIFSHCWKIYDLGPLVGRRTWGGVVGIWPRHALVDGTVTTQSEFANWFEDAGFAVENYGTDPDLPVDNLPQDHKAGKDRQLERGMAEMKRILAEKKPGPPDFGPRPSMKPPRLPKTK